MPAYRTPRGSVELGTAIMFLCYPLILMGIARLRLRCIATGRGGSSGPLMGLWFQSYGAERRRIFQYRETMTGMGKRIRRCIATGRGGSSGPLMGPWFQSYGAERRRI